MHTAELVETHRFTVPRHALPNDGAGALDVLRLHVRAYERARGIEIVGSLRATVGFADRREVVGVEFDVVVGKGDIALDQRTPGALDRWTWSAGAVEWWRDHFPRLVHSGWLRSVPSSLPVSSARVWTARDEEIFRSVSANPDGSPRDTSDQSKFNGADEASANTDE